MYSQNRYQQEEIDRVQAEAEKMYLNKRGEYNGRDDHGREERGRRYSDEYDDRRRSSGEYDDRRRSGERNDSYGYNDRYGGHDERDREYNNDRHDNDRGDVRYNHVPVPTTHVPTTHVPTTHVPTTHVSTTHVPTTHVPTTHVPTTHVPVAHVPVAHVPVPTPYVHVPVSTNIKKYRAATYDKHDKIFAQQMQNFIVPAEFNTFTCGLLKEVSVNRLCLLEAIADYNKIGGPALPEDFQKAAEHCRKYRAVKYDIHDQTYAKQMQFYELPLEFSEFTDGLLKETHINRFDLLEAIDNYNAKGLPQLPCVFQEVAFNCRPYQQCVIC